MGKAFSTLIRNRRTELDLSRADVARRGGLPPSRVAYLERVDDARSIQPETVRALAIALDLPLADLLEAAGYGADGGAA